MTAFRRVCRHAVAALAVAACGSVSPSPTDTAPPTGLWVFHVEGGRFADHVQLLTITQVDDQSWPLRLSPLPTRDWTGQAVTDFAVVTTFGRVDGPWVSWTLPLLSGEVIQMRYQLTGDTARGVLDELGGAGSGTEVPLVGVRISAPVWMSRWAASASVLPADGPPVVLLRLDDDPTTDPAFIAKMQARSLYGELSIPTQWVGVAGRPDWQALHQLVDGGFSVAAHSRTHGVLSGSSAEFMGEVVGSLEDLASQQLSTPVFVQPGTWADSLYFGSPAQFHNWRGALFRTFTSDMEAYAYPGSTDLPVADSLRLGLGHYTISNKPAAWVLSWWAQAVSARRFTVFLVHTFDVQPPDTLDWFLDSVAVAVKAGRVRLARSSAELFQP
jgi:hypothetical protein